MGSHSFMSLPFKLPLDPIEPGDQIRVLPGLFSKCIPDFLKTLIFLRKVRAFLGIVTALRREELV